MTTADYLAIADRLADRAGDDELLLAGAAAVRLLCAEVEALSQTSAEPCPVCGWRMVVPNDGCRNCETIRLRAEVEALRAASELALGILWMIEDRNGKVRDAHRVLLDALGKEGLKRGIAAAIGRGYEAEHPSGADWWAGKKE